MILASLNPGFVFTSTPVMYSTRFGLSKTDLWSRLRWNRRSARTSESIKPPEYPDSERIATRDRAGRTHAFGEAKRGDFTDACYFERIIGAANAGALDRFDLADQIRLFDRARFQARCFRLTAPRLALLHTHEAATATGKRQGNDGADEIQGHSRHLRTMCGIALRHHQRT